MGWRSSRLITSTGLPMSVFRETPRPRDMRGARALCTLGAFALTLGACDDRVLPMPEQNASFTLTTSGSSTVALTGSTLVLAVQPDGFRTTVSGREYVRDLTPVVLVQSTASPAFSPQLTMNFLGPLQRGILRVHRDGNAPGVNTEVQARLIVPISNDVREHYLIDGGTITVTSINPLVATFAFTGTQRLRMPENPAVGQSYTSHPAPITVTGRIGAP